MYSYINFTTGGCMTAPKGWYIPKTYIVNRLYYIYSGSAFLNGSKEALEQNRVYVFPSTMKFDITQDDNSPCHHLFFDFIMIPPLSGTVPVVYDVAENSELYYLLRAASELLKIHGSAYERQLYKNQIEKYFRRIWELINIENPVETMQNRVVNDAVLYMNNNYMNNITIDSIAEKVDRNVNYFIRLFRQCTGITPYHYLTELRMDKATVMIHNGESIGNTAFSVGFDSISAFSTSYKKHRGISPAMLIGKK